MRPDSRFSSRSAVIISSHQIDSDLGSWTHSEWRPAVDHPLSWVVERIWDFDGRVACRRERVFPSATLELIVQLDDRYHDVDGARLRPTPATCVTGIQTGPMIIEAPPRRCRVLGVRFHPLGAWAILQHPLADLTGVTADLYDVVGRTAGNLASRCDDARSASERVHRTIQWLCDRILTPVGPPPPSNAVRWVAGRIDRAGGAVRIRSLRAETGISTSRLSAAFLHQIGVTPKRFARIHRFRRALEMLHRTPARLSEIALRAGYYDQPHMTVEFRELAGLTPRQFLAARRYPASSSMADV